MTVENQVNKTEPQVMGTNFDYAFTFTVLTKDPTEDIAKQAIKVIVSDGITQTQLTYGTDYSVTLNKNGIGGTVTVTDKRTSDYSLIVYREYDFKQESDYQNYNAFPADTMEQNLDKLTMIAQQLKEKSDRAVTVDIFFNTDPSSLVNEIEALYGVKEEVITAADNIDSIVTAAENIEAIVDAPDQAAAAAQSATLAHQSEDNALSYKDDARDHATRADGSAMSASNSANLAQTWATGNIDVRPEGSAKYWAELAEQKAGLNTVRTNCLTSVPQPFNIELSNGTLTLKAGSKVYDGNGLFKAISSDISLTPSGYVDVPHVLIVKNDGTLYARAVIDCSSGAINPSTDTWLHYNTTDKKLYIINAGVNVGTASFPLCVFNVSGGRATSVSQTFNYMGYIGNTIFTLQNLRGMRPNGFNVDGTLNNVEFQANSILTTTFTSSYTGYIVINSGLLAGWNVNNGRYNPDKNVNEYDGVKSDVSIVGTFSTDSTCRIISFNPKLPFQAVDASDYRSLAGLDSNIDYIVESARNGKSWYAKYRSGRLEQGGNIASQTPVVYLKPFKNTNYQIVLGQSGSSQSGTVGRTTWNNKTTTGFTPSFVTETDWLATGEGA